MKSLSRTALIEWAQLQEALEQRNKDKVNPNSDPNNLTIEERNARLEVKINNLIQYLRAEKDRKLK